jgi:hypothetical protein
MVKLILTGLAAGVAGTLLMDVMNHLLAKTGWLLKIDMNMIGRMSAGWAHGCFFYQQPDEIKPVANEFSLGIFTHYTISVLFALVYVLGWELLVGGPASPAWALAYGLATTAAPQFLVYPSMGLGAFGRRSPDGLRAPLSSLANHLFFGVGMAIVLALW